MEFFQIIGSIIGFVLIICLFLLPSIVAVKSNHPQKIPIIIVNILGGLLWGIGWLVSLVWVFIKPNTNQENLNQNIGSELEKLHELKEKGILSQEEFDSKKTKLLQ